MWIKDSVLELCKLRKERDDRKAKYEKLKKDAHNTDMKNLWFQRDLQPRGITGCYYREWDTCTHEKTTPLHDWKFVDRKCDKCHHELGRQAIHKPTVEAVAEWLSEQGMVMVSASVLEHFLEDE